MAGIRLHFTRLLAAIVVVAAATGFDAATTDERDNLTASEGRCGSA